MFDELQACIIVIIVDETRAVSGRVVGFLQRSRRRRSVLLRHPPADKMSANAA